MTDSSELSSAGTNSENPWNRPIETKCPRKPSVGFVIVTFNRPEQLLFLCRRLNTMFGAPPIAVHHDFSQSELDKTAFPPTVRFVESWIKTSWGTNSVVRALLAALELLYGGTDRAFGDPDWVISLSGTDYPIQSAETILSHLAATSFDGFLDSRLIMDPGGFYRNQPSGEDPFQQPLFHKGAFNRYVAIPVVPLHIARRYRIPVERFCLPWKWLTAHLTPFRGDLRCYAGDAWFTVNRRVARLFLRDDERRQTLLRHYDSRSTPEESFYHTLLGNTPGFNISPDNLRYTDWKGCFAHPRLLGSDDLPALLASNAHFARKFPYDPDLFHEMDEGVAERDQLSPVMSFG